eukprot:6204249-Pleurochrysis_carterae.AAC.3
MQRRPHKPQQAAKAPAATASAGGNAAAPDHPQPFSSTSNVPRAFAAEPDARGSHDLRPELLNVVTSRDHPVKWMLCAKWMIAVKWMLCLLMLQRWKLTLSTLSPHRPTLSRATYEL